MNNPNKRPSIASNPESGGVLVTSEGDASQGLSASAIVRPPFVGSIPLSIAQQQVWLHGQLAAGVPLYNEVLILERVGPLEREALDRSFAEIIRRHETLHTTFAVEDGSPAQIIAEHHEMELPITELSGSTSQNREASVLRIATEEARQLFDLTKGPLIRARLLRLSKQNHILVVTLHTIIADEWSLSILSDELATLYEAYSAGEPSPLPDLPIRYADYLHSQRDWLQGDVLDSHISYWRKRLADLPVLELPTDRARPQVQGFRGARESLQLPRNLSESLKDLSELESVPFFVTLLAAFQTLLSRYTGQRDVVVGSIAPGREEVGTENLIGLFAHTVLIRTEIERDATFRELLGRVSDLWQRDCEYQNMPFDRLVGEFQLGRDLSRNPLFQVLVSFTPPMSAARGGWEIMNLEVDDSAAKVDLQLQLCDRAADGIFARFTYNTDIFDAATIRRMAGHFQRLLEGVVANPDQRLSKLPLLTQPETHQLLAERNNTRTNYPKDRPLHHLFESQVDRTPEATAVAFGNESLTYRELNQRANQLAHHLVSLGVGPDVLVGILVERSLEMVVGLLGILKAGGAYVPLDPAYPSERIAFMLEDSEVAVLLTQRHLLETISDSRARVVVLDTDWHEIATAQTDNPVHRSGAENLAYVIYTSGSTGKPKGVQIPHRALVNFLTSMSHTPGMTEADRLLSVTTLSFDIAGLELYLPLIVGAAVEIVSREVSSDGYQLLSKLVSSGATVMQATPVTWRMLIEAGWEGTPNLKILCGGEAISRKLATQLLQRGGSLWNMYGPTETTIWSTCCRIASEHEPIVIGRPIANTEIFILDELLQPVPIGVAGELHIGGEGLARGYLKRPELTAEKFIASPFAQHPDARLYKTGDLARYRPNGDIECLGRIDHQVKLRGFRIELGDIESALRQHRGLNDTVVVAREDTPGDKRLVAYFVPSQEAPATVGELRDFLKEKLPKYMVPAVFVALEAMPLTPNGKVNRRALPAPEQTSLAPSENFAAPTNDLEFQLVTIWQEVLGVRPIGIRDSFFELGGNSLVAVRLMQRIEQAFGKHLSIATLFQAPTIEQLAGILRQKGWSPAWSSLVPIQTGGSKPPFFCVHGVGGNVLRFYGLAQHLGSEQPFYALQAQGLNENYPCHTRAEDMAAHYVKEIRSVQPEGPYFLGGYSFGGMIALEMAQQLIAQGEEPPVVVLFDTLCPAARGIPPSQELTSFSSPFLNILRISGSERQAYLSRVAKAPLRAIQWGLHVAKLPRKVRKVRNACLKAARYYAPRAYPGRAILFRSSREPLGGLSDPYAGWSKYLANGLQVCEVKSNHDNILLEPQVQLVADHLRTFLNEAQRAWQFEGMIK
ncbi:MAG: amino acid adenylation domain-containing protein [Candidatus Sulfotelmatobacter sp.]